MSNITISPTTTYTNLILGDEAIKSKSEIEQRSLTPSNFCIKHVDLLVKCNQCSKNVCKTCVIFNKEEMDHWHEHYEFIKFDVPWKNNNSLNLKEDSFYEKINSIAKNSIEKSFDQIHNFFKEFSKLKLMKTHLKNKALQAKKSIDYRIKCFNDDTIQKAKQIFENKSLTKDKQLVELGYLETRFKNNNTFNTKSTIQDFYSKHVSEMNAYNKLLSNSATNKVNINDLLENETINEDFQTTFKDIQNIPKINNKVSNNNYVPINAKKKFKSCSVKENSDSANINAYEVLYDSKIVNVSFLIIKVKVVELPKLFPNKFWNFFFGFSEFKKDHWEIEKYVDSYREKNFIENIRLNGIFFQSNGWLSRPYSNIGNFKKLSEPLKVNDEIFFIKDTVNSLWLSINNLNEKILIMENLHELLEYSFIVAYDSSNTQGKFEVEEMNILEDF